MAIQLILCLETNKKADTDGIYIMETIRNRYILDNKTKISRVYMTTKSKYKSKDVLKDIKDKRDQYSKVGESVVIYCIDTDDYEKNYDHKKEWDEINDYCIENGFELIWFCHDVEEVYWGERVSDSEKKDRAIKFKAKKMINNIDLKKLFCDKKKSCFSKIITVLDKYLKKK